MKLFFLANILFSYICYAQDVSSVGEKVLKTMEEMSTSWKLAKDTKSAAQQGKKTQLLSKQLVSLAEELKSYPRPDNATRKKIKASRSNKIKKISKEMAETIVMMSSNAPLMSAFASELQKIKKEMDKSKQIFDFYFEPDTTSKQKK